MTYRMPALMLLFMMYLQLTFAAYFNFQPHSITQPDGEVVHCFVSGDEFFNFLHDANGYTIIQAPDGYYYYGVESDGLVEPSPYKVNSINPSTAGLSPWAKISTANYQKKKDFMMAPVDKSVKGPQTGLLNNIVIYIRFSDDSEFTVTRGSYDTKFNSTTGTSLYHYFKEVSYNMLDIVSSHYPICNLTTNLSWQDTYPRNYYQAYNATSNPNGYVDDDDRRDREHTLLVNAVNGVSSQIPTSLVIDADGDNRVDNVSFIIRGNSGAWAELLWAHRWSLYSQTVNIHGKRVYDYTFQPENQTSVQTLSHEMFHSVGSPDLYRYSQDGFNPVGSWDLMASGFVHMGAYMKWKYTNQNWIATIPEITTPGTYTLWPLSSPVNNAYKIASPNNPDEFFILEYRRKMGTYETNVPGSGIVIYRINPLAGNGNADGPPDEVYVYRPNGTLTDNGTIGTAFFSSNTGRTTFNDASNPSCFLSDNIPGGIEIFDITSADTTISFSFGVDYKPMASFEALPRQSCTGQVAFVDKSTKSPTTWFWDFGDGTTSTQQHPSHTYTTNGYKTVKLKVTNSHGIDSLRLLNYVRIQRPIAPQTTGASNCQPGTFTLQATAQAGGQLKWYNQPVGGTLLHTGTTYQTPFLNTTTNYYVEELTPASIVPAGALSNAIGDGGYFNNTNTHYLIFDAFNTMTLKSVKVYAQNTKDRTIVIKDEDDNIIHDTTINLTSGEHRIELNFTIPVGVNYKIECTTPNSQLYRNSNGSSYPYTVNNLLSITDNSAGNPDYYYYFYDWEVIGTPCISVRDEVSAAILQPQASFTHTNQNLAVQFTNTSQNALSYLWEFGDGNTSTAQNPLHTYASEGNYNVKLTITNSCGTDSVINQIPVFIAGMPHNANINPFTLYPNPVGAQINLSFNTSGIYQISINDIYGRTVYQANTDAIPGTVTTIPTTDLSSGIYMLHVVSDKRYTTKIIKL